MKEYYLNSTYHYISTDEKSNETILEQKQTTANNIIPERASLGVGYGHDGKWFASTQFDFKKWQDIKFLGNPMQIKDSYRMSVGVGIYLITITSEIISLVSYTDLERIMREEG